eukprot:Rhum_TRINITY_DN14082_c20_g1::Rhum_TRINITY_DN14082_c20_g1_i1::g.67177::m.67177
MLLHGTPPALQLGVLSVARLADDVVLLEVPRQGLHVRVEVELRCVRVGGRLAQVAEAVCLAHVHVQGVRVVHQLVAEVAQRMTSERRRVLRTPLKRVLVQPQLLRRVQGLLCRKRGVRVEAHRAQPVLVPRPHVLLQGLQGREGGLDAAVLPAEAVQPSQELDVIPHLFRLVPHVPPGLVLQVRLLPHRSRGRWPLKVRCDRDALDGRLSLAHAAYRRLRLVGVDVPDTQGAAPAHGVSARVPLAPPAPLLAAHYAAGTAFLVAAEIIAAVRILVLLLLLLLRTLCRRRRLHNNTPLLLCLHRFLHCLPSSSSSSP